MDEIIDIIKYAVFLEYGVSVADMEGTNREYEIMHARHVAVYCARRLTFISLKRIGWNFGGRDHSTALHSIQKIQQLLTPDRRGNTSYEAQRVEKLLMELENLLEPKA